MQYYSAIREGADAIITRNSDDFDAAQIEVYEPQKRGQQDGTEIRNK